MLIEGDNRRLQTVCIALKFFFDFSGHWDDWLSLSTEAEAKARRTKDFYNAGWRANDAAHWQATRAGARERSVAFRLRGHGYLLAKNYSAAITAYREALELDPSLSPKSEDVSISLNELAAHQSWP
ncbi:MAG TPA: tetratricopeptide repeat protein [Thermoanaerobaculia bacterium]|nr:tetratricopeptide repeat protein [Thermoanaerobaculia bacterium]